MRCYSKFFAAIFLCGSSLASSAHAASWYVSPCGQDVWLGVQPGCMAPLGPKHTIQAAIDLASDGDTVFVLPGTYFETIDFNGKEISVLGSGGAAVTTIDGLGAGPVVLCNSLEGAGTVLQGLTITGGFTNDSGGGMLNVLSTPTVIECVFEANLAVVSGGAMANFVASPTIIDCEFIDNSIHLINSEGIGGAIFSAGGVVGISGSGFTDNRAVAFGAAIAMTDSSVYTIDDSTFTGNAAIPQSGSMGGAVYINASTAAVTDSSFTDNSVRYNGGAVACVNGADASFTTTDFTNNSSLENSGGAISVESSTLSLFGCGLNDNFIEAALGSDQGGGALFAENSDVSIALCGFNGNHANMNTGGTGGAIFSEATDLTVSASTFVNNNAALDGGAISSIGGGDLTVGGSTFSENLSPEYGAGIAVEFGALTISDSTFVDNGSALTRGGGGLNVSGTSGFDGSVSDCTFTGNEAINGGGFRITGGALAVTECDFEMNSSQNVGGGMLVSGSAIVRLSGSDFTNNISQGGGGGLGVAATADVVGCNYSGNSAPRGAGAYILSGSGNATLVGCRFENNIATDGSAALMITTNSEARLTNSVVIGNTSPFSSGAVSDGSPGIGSGIAGDILEIRNCTIAENIGGGIHMENEEDPSITIHNTIVRDNTLGGSITGAGVVAEYSNIDGGFAGIGNIDEDPLFENPVLGNYHLAAGSPSIDAGLNAAVPADSTDLDADADIVELIPFDFDGNDRITTVFGCGGDVTVDMGAFEAPGVTAIALGDLTGDGIVDVEDLTVLLAAWGVCSDTCCSADLNHNGTVDGSDLAILLARWG